MTTSTLSHPAAELAAGAPPEESHSERLRSLVEQHFAFVWRSLQRARIPEGDIDDVIQRVFLTLSRRLGEIRAGAERSFLFAAAMREAGHVRRTQRRRGEVGTDALQDKSTGTLRPDELVSRRQALELVSQALDQMDDDLNTVFILCEVEELSSNEAAEALGIPVGTVKSRLRRAREDFAARTRALRAGGGRS